MRSGRKKGNVTSIHRNPYPRLSLNKIYVNRIDHPEVSMNHSLNNSHWADIWPDPSPFNLFAWDEYIRGPHINGLKRWPSIYVVTWSFWVEAGREIDRLCKTTVIIIVTGIWSLLIVVELTFCKRIRDLNILILLIIAVCIQQNHCSRSNQDS